jgi:hypothetical protein
MAASTDPWWEPALDGPPRPLSQASYASQGTTYTFRPHAGEMVTPAGTPLPFSPGPRLRLQLRWTRDRRLTARMVLAAVGAA